MITSLFAVVITIIVAYYRDRLSLTTLETDLKWAGFILGSVGTLGLMTNSLGDSMTGRSNMTHDSHLYPDAMQTYLHPATIRDWKTVQLEMLESFRFSILLFTAAILTASCGFFLGWLVA